MYSYNITVEFGSNKWDKQEGKMQATLKSGRSQHKVQLSPNNEGLWSGLTRFYTGVAPFPIENIDRVGLKYSSKGFHFTKQKVYVDRVILDPAYNMNFA